MISTMRSVEIVGPLVLFDATVDTIQETGVLHIEEVPVAEEGGADWMHRFHLSPEQQQQKDRLEELLRLLEEGTANIPAPVLQRLTGAAALMELYRRWEREPSNALAAAARMLHARVRSFQRRERNLSDDLRVLASYEEVAVALAPLVEGEELPRSWQFLGVVLERKNRLAADLLKRELRRLTGGRFRYVQAGLSRGRAAALIGFPRDVAPQVRVFVEKAGIGEMSFPRYLRDRPFEEALATLEDDLAQLRERQRELRELTERFYEENGLQMTAMRLVCRDQLARYEALNCFVRTDYVFIIRGWVLSDRLADLTERLAEQVGSPVVVRRIHPRTMGRPPVLLRNPVAIRSFEPLIGLLPLPAYGSIDPTVFVACFFPPMFGLMLGDVGYGLILVAGAALLRLLGGGRRILARLSVVVAFCAFFTIGFGLLFGEFFGDFGHGIGLRPLWRERFSLEGGDMTEALLGYLAITVGVGFLHVMFGLVLGVINSRRARDSGGVTNNLARIAGILILFFFVGRLADLLPPVFSSLGIVALIAFLVLMIYHTLHHPTHGLLLPLEVLGAVGNILSYARIMAIGMVSVVLALLANMFGGMIGNVVLAAVIVILIHALNLSLGIFDPTIQGLRLHYVEFFSKFFLSGGRQFTPFTKIGVAPV